MSVRRMERPGFYRVECNCRTVEWDVAKGAGVILFCKRCHIRNAIPGPSFTVKPDADPRPVRAFYRQLEY